jgi:hypothetical protein
MSNSDVKTYGPDEVSLILAGIPLNQGWADGTFCRIAYNSDAFSLKVGTDGESVRTKSNDRSARISVILMQSSSVNDLLSALHNLDINSPGGAGVGPFLCKDNSGRSMYLAEKAWIVKPPDAEYGREAGTREWIIETGNLQSFVGGN